MWALHRERDFAFHSHAFLLFMIHDFAWYGIPKTQRSR